MKQCLASLRQALPSPARALTGALFWGALMGVNMLAFLCARGWQTLPQVAALTSIFALGAALAFPVGHTFQALLARKSGPEVRFAAAFVSFALTTICITAALYALQYRAYYAQWHGDPLSVRWILQFVFTTAGAVYQFAVIGLRVYFPWGLAALFALSYIYAAKPR
ncbi:hypothetical protein ACFPOD_00825 [Nitratireductor kimnyeongensis]|uniref:Uncharacterized protein n=1 Tax=Nitratireductor kimnyeongensis TaxID=430679 RepID=A0ABW0T3E4_9HYPH|nr:hypothetical protein [Nitratireductor kimnyeongensis]QZZ35306.1 hypothetical protein KW403_16370 [Nitratireductor kimnyeongensis]